MRISKMPLRAAMATALAAGGTMALAPLPVMAQTASAPANSLQLATGRGRLVTVDVPMAEVFVANPEVADVHLSTTKQVYIFGKAPGETTVYATSQSGAVVYSATVRVGNNIDSIDSMLALAMPDANITATTMNGFVLLTGTVGSPADVAEAERLVQAFVGEDTEVISRLRTATPLQVNLQVRFAEVSRSFAKNIGANTQTRSNDGGFQFGSSLPVRSGTFSSGATAGLPTVDVSAAYGLPEGSVSLPFNPSTGKVVLPSGEQHDFSTLPEIVGRAGLGVAARVLGLDVLTALDLGETNGQVTTLAEPNLTALSGETGTFLAGGEIPIPIAQGLGAVSIEYKQYGVSLAFTPTVLADGRISLRVRPEVSQLSAAGAVQFQGTTIPAITTRRAETTVELGSGESFMIAGLLSNSHDNSIDKVPGVGDLPVLGALFRSNSFQRNETELVIVITPYLVKPVNANEIVLPTDGYRTPGDVERILGGQLSGSTKTERPRPTMAPPTGAAPAIGAAQPVPAEPAKPSRREGGSAAPGFSLN
jgi:pilus assembly protein CpaC